jgi:amino acid transporter
MSLDGWLTAAFDRENRRGVPWSSLLTLAFCSSAAALLNFDRLITMDVLLYGASLLLEFAALAWLRMKEPGMPRPFRVPGGNAVAWLLGAPALLLLSYAAWSSRPEQMLGHPAWQLCVLIAAAGPLVYLLARSL